MKIYLVTWLELSQGMALTKAGYRNRLLSYHFLKDLPKGKLGQYVTTGEFEGTEPLKDRVRLFLDSGAFSAWKQNEAIDLHKYMDFIQENHEFIETYVNLDDLADPKKTWRNQREMEKQGLKPLPVYHEGEDDKFLFKAMEYDYFGIGGVALQTPGLKQRTFDKIFRDHQPKNKIHCFGTTSFWLLRRYPWYSVDSTSWVMTSRNGSVFVPKYHDNEFKYGLDPHKIIVSSRSTAKEKDGQHLFTLSKIQQKQIMSYITSHGFTWEMLDEYSPRDILNVSYFKELEEYLSTKHVCEKLYNKMREVI